MALNRDQLLKDLKDNIIECHFYPDTKMPRVRVTLDPKHLPKSFLENQEQLKEMTHYHKTYPTFVGAWNIDRKTWVYFDVETVNYVESIEDYY